MALSVHKYKIIHHGDWTTLTKGLKETFLGINFSTIDVKEKIINSQIKVIGPEEEVNGLLYLLDHQGKDLGILKNSVNYKCKLKRGYITAYLENKRILDKTAILYSLLKYPIYEIKSNVINGNEVWSLVSTNSTGIEFTRLLFDDSDVEVIGSDSLNIRKKEDLIQNFNETKFTVFLLTNSEREVLNLAFQMGYFSYPRKVMLSDLASKLNVSKTNINKLLRSAVYKIINSAVMP